LPAQEGLGSIDLLVVNEGEFEVKGSLGMCRHRWGENIEIDLEQDGRY
jgi:hypothetical protein